MQDRYLTENILTQIKIQTDETPEYSKHLLLNSGKGIQYEYKVLNVIFCC